MRGLIYLHGYGVDIKDFDDVCNQIKDSYDHIFIENLPGSESMILKGFNAKSNLEASKSIVKRAFDLCDEVDIVGYSMGGTLAFNLALDYKFRRIVLISPSNKLFSIGGYLRKFIIYFKVMIKFYDKNVRYEFKMIMSENIFIIKRLFTNMTKYFGLSLFKLVRLINHCNKRLKKKDQQIENVVIIYGNVDQLIPHKSIKFIRRFCKDETYYEIPYANHAILNSAYKRNVYDLIIKSLK